MTIASSAGSMPGTAFESRGIGSFISLCSVLAALSPVMSRCRAMSSHSTMPIAKRSAR